MTILITGGAGFIGQHLGRQLYARGEQLIALDSLHPQVHLDPDSASRAFHGDVVVGDVAEPAAWASIPEISAIIHLAAETGTGQSMYEIDRYRRVNVGGTRLAAETAASRGIPLVSLSSRAVYGEGRAECAEHGTVFGQRCCDRAVAVDSTEEDDHHPVSVYGETKSEAEQSASEVMQGRAPLAIIRPQNVIGPGQALHNPYTGVLAAFLARLREGRPLSIYGDGSQTRDFIHVSDLAQIIVWSLDRLIETGENLVVNAGTGIRVPLTDLARFAIAGSPHEDAVIEHVEVHRAGDIQDACADMSRLRALGGPMPKIAPADAVADFIRWSWDRPGAQSQAWDEALAELESKGLTS